MLATQQTQTVMEFQFLKTYFRRQNKEITYTPTIEYIPNHKT